MVQNERNTKSNTYINNYTTSKSKPAHPRTAVALPLCTAAEGFWNRYAHEFGSLDTSLVRWAKSDSIAEATPDV